MNAGELDYPIDRFHELNKDAMLEKLVLISSWYFWVATELRSLSQDLNISQNSEMITRKHAEMWHAQSAYIGALFLPNQWPLADHFMRSYEKYYIVGRQNDSEGKLGAAL